MFKNKHVMIAMLVAPVLALLSYFAVDYYVSEEPHQAKAGKSYKMIERPNCRYTSGKCDLKNGSFEVGLKVEILQKNKMLLKLDSNFALDGVKIAIVQTQESNPIPVDMQLRNNNKKTWEVKINQPASEESRIHLVMAIGESYYFAETATTFFQDDRKFNTR